MTGDPEKQLTGMGAIDMGPVQIDVQLSPAFNSDPGFIP